MRPRRGPATFNADRRRHARRRRPARPGQGPRGPLPGRRLVPRRPPGRAPGPAHQRGGARDRGRRWRGCRPRRDHRRHAHAWPPASARPCSAPVTVAAAGARRGTSRQHRDPARHRARPGRGGAAQAARPRLRAARRSPSSARSPSWSSPGSRSSTGHRATPARSPCPSVVDLPLARRRQPKIRAADLQSQRRRRSASTKDEGTVVEPEPAGERPGQRGLEGHPQRVGRPEHRGGPRPRGLHPSRRPRTALKNVGPRAWASTEKVEQHPGREGQLVVESSPAAGQSVDVGSAVSAQGLQRQGRGARRRRHDPRRGRQHPQRPRLHATDDHVRRSATSPRTPSSSRARQGAPSPTSAARSR